MTLRFSIVLLALVPTCGFGKEIMFCGLINFYLSETIVLQEIIQEQITRVLLERLIVNRPHPWGLLITFIELIKVVIGKSDAYFFHFVSNLTESLPS